MSECEPTVERAPWEYPLCRDCKHLRGRTEKWPGPPDGKSLHPDVSCVRFRSPSTGEGLYCHVARGADFLCGIEGRGFEEAK